MAGGRPRKAVHIKEAQGTLAKSREITDPAIGEVMSILPAVPVGMTEDEEKYFLYCCDELLNLGLLTSQFIVSIEMAAIWYREFCEARRFIRENGGTQKTQSGYTQINGYFTQMKESYRMLRDFENSYGLNLVSAQKINLPDPHRDDDLQKLMDARLR